MFKLFPEEAPWHVANLNYLAKSGIYKNANVRHLQPAYILQFGVPGSTHAPYTLPSEFNSQKHVRGALGMARREDRSNPDRASDAYSSHILLSEAPHMDGAYTVFGNLETGSEVLSRLEEGDAIEDLSISRSRP